MVELEARIVEELIHRGLKARKAMKLIQENEWYVLSQWTHGASAELIAVSLLA